MVGTANLQNQFAMPQLQTNYNKRNVTIPALQVSQWTTSVSSSLVVPQKQFIMSLDVELTDSMSDTTSLSELIVKGAVTLTGSILAISTLHIHSLHRLSIHKIPIIAHCCMFVSLLAQLIQTVTEQLEHCTWLVRPIYTFEFTEIL